MKKWIVAVVFLLGIGIQVKAEITTKKELVHMIERSRVVSMRIIKAHALISIKNKFKNPEKELVDSYTLLKQNLEEIHFYIQIHTSEYDVALLPLIKKAQEFFTKLDNNDLLHDLRSEKAIAFFQALEKSRVQINKAAEILTKDKKQRDPIFFTTRISTIAQKMAAVYLYKTWGILLPKLDEHFKMMTGKSKKSIKALKFYAQKSGSTLNQQQQEEIAKSILSMQNNIEFFVMSQNMKHFIPSLLYHKANIIEEASIRIEKTLSPLR